MYVLIHYFCKENSEREIKYIHPYLSQQNAQAEMESDVSHHLNEILKDEVILHEYGFNNWHIIDVRGGNNSWYTWEIQKLSKPLDAPDKMQNTEVSFDDSNQ